MAAKYFLSISEIAAHYGKSDRQIAKHLKAHPEFRKKDPKRKGKFRYPQKAWDEFYSEIEEKKATAEEGAVVVVPPGGAAAGEDGGDGEAAGEEICIAVEEALTARAQRQYRQLKVRLAALELAVKEGRLLSRDWVEAQFTARAFDLKRSLKMLGRRISHKVAEKTESKIQEVESVIDLEVDQMLEVYSRPIQLEH